MAESARGFGSFNENSFLDIYAEVVLKDLVVSLIHKNWLASWVVYGISTFVNSNAAASLLSEPLFGTVAVKSGQSEPPKIFDLHGEMHFSHKAVYLSFFSRPASCVGESNSLVPTNYFFMAIKCKDGTEHLVKITLEPAGGPTGTGTILLAKGLSGFFIIGPVSPPAP